MMGFINLNSIIIYHTLSFSLAVFNNNSGANRQSLRRQMKHIHAIADSVEQGVTVVLEMVSVLSPPLIHMNYFL